MTKPIDKSIQERMEIIHHTPLDSLTVEHVTRCMEVVERLPALEDQITIVKALAALRAITLRHNRMAAWATKNARAIAESSK